MLTFQERAEGFRVVRLVGEAEHMLASMTTKSLSGYDEKGAAVYVNLPREKCEIHSAIGALEVVDIEEMLAHLPKE